LTAHRFFPISFEIQFIVEEYLTLDTCFSIGEKQKNKENSYKNQGKNLLKFDIYVINEYIVDKKCVLS